jgi:hypothetical protein
MDPLVYPADGCYIFYTTGQLHLDLTSSCFFSVNSLYLDHMNDHIKFICKYILKLKVPLKIKKIMWFLYRKVLTLRITLQRETVRETKNVFFNLR